MMNKQKMMAAVTIATMTLSAGASVFADEKETVIGEEKVTEVVEGTPEVVEPTVPSEELPPVSDTDTGTAIGGKDTAVDTPADGAGVVVEEPTKSIEQPNVEPAKPDREPVKDKVEKPAEEQTKPTDSEPKDTPKTESTPPQEDKGSQAGQISTSTGQKVEDLGIEKPIVTDAGVKIVGTQNAQVIVQREDGSTEMLAAEAVGATVNEDKTVSVKASDGKMKTLPNTGQEMMTSVAMTVTGILGLIGTVVVKVKEWLG